MSRRAIIPTYLLLLLVLAALGAYNQGRYRLQAELIDHKDELHIQLTDLRAQAARIQGPLAVGRWALAHRMVPAPENENLVGVAPLAAPFRELPATGLEMRTVWR